MRRIRCPSRGTGHRIGACRKRKGLSSVSAAIDRPNDQRRSRPPSRCRRSACRRLKGPSSADRTLYGDDMVANREFFVAVESIQKMTGYRRGQDEPGEGDQPDRQQEKTCEPGSGRLPRSQHFRETDALLAVVLEEAAVRLHLNVREARLREK